MLDLAARLALQGAVRVLDGGNCFNVYHITRSIRRQTTDLSGVLGRISLSRAFTCYQMAALLAETPGSSCPTLIPDLLATFYDEAVRLEESQRLLRFCLQHLRRLSYGAPVIASASPPRPVCTGRGGLLDLLQEAAGQLWMAEPLPDAPPVLRLFEE